jgi:hypothetical protein
MYSQDSNVVTGDAGAIHDQGGQNLAGAINRGSKKRLGEFKKRVTGSKVLDSISMKSATKWAFLNALLEAGGSAER